MAGTIVLTLLAAAVVLILIELVLNESGRWPK